MKKHYFALLTFFLSSVSLLQAQYCTPTTNCSVGDGVTLMGIGPFSNSSGCESDMGIDGYADFTDLTGLELGQGVTYEGIFQSGFGSQQFSIWIDADNSESFESSELIMTDLAVGTEIATTTITIPPSLALGDYRLRIKANYFAPSSDDPCANTTYGETEDYTLTVTEPPTCINVSGIQTTALSATTATIAWSDPGTGSTWDIEWGPAGFTPTGMPSPGFDNVDNPAMLTGLNPVTEYDVYIRADCGEDNETDVSVWTSGFSFITACGAVIPTYIEDFNNGLGACWEIYGDGDLTTGPVDGGFSNWFNDGFANTPNVFQGSQGNYVGDIGILDWLVSPDVDLSVDGGPYQLEFDFALTAAFNQDSVFLDENDQIRLLISTDFGTTWSTMELWNDEEGAVEPTGEHFIYDLTAYDGEIARFAIWISSGEDGEFNSFEAFFDNFIVQPLGSPMNVQIDQIVEPNCFQFGGNPLADVLISISGGVYPYIFDWSNDTSNEDLIDAEEGTYTLTVTDAEGNEYVSDPIDVPGNPTVTVTAIVTDESFAGYADGSIDITDIVGSDGPYTFYWNNGTTNQDVDGLFDANWQVTITDASGCQTDTTFTILGGGTPPVTIDEFAESIGLNLYPNPSNNGVANINADLSSGNEWELQIVDAMGRIISSEYLYKVGSIAHVIDISAQSNGVYNVRIIRKDDGKETSRLLIR